MLSLKQKIALGIASAVYAAQCTYSYKLYKANKILLDAGEKMVDFSNRSAYMNLYLIVKLAESDVGLTEFDRQVMSNPPLLIDPENPNLFGEVFERYAASGFDGTVVEDFFKTLEKIRTADQG